MLVGEYTVIKKAKKILSLADLRDRIRQRYYDRQDRILEKNSWKDFEKEQKRKINEKIMNEIKAEIENKVKEELEKQKEEACEECRKEGHAEGFATGRTEGIAQGRSEGEHTAMLEAARKMLAKHYDIDAIAEMTELPIEEIQKL